MNNIETFKTGAEKMDKNKSFGSEIYNICHLLHITSGLDVRFIDVAHTESFYFSREAVPHIFEAVKQNVENNITVLMKDYPRTNFLYYTDSFKLSYLAVGKWDRDLYRGAIIMGPFLFDLVNESFISKVIEKNKLPVNSGLSLLAFYKSLSMLETEKFTYLGHLMVNLAVNPFVSGKISYIEELAPRKDKKEEYREQVEEQHSNIELRYKLQHELDSAVEKGLKEEALRINNLLRFNVSHRVPGDPFRAYKNFAYSFNTILRIAIEKGGVHPVYVHNISDKYAILIEKTKGISELENLQIQMICEYCDMVKKYSSAGYSPLVRNAINYIYLNLDDNIFLSSIAENIKANPWHLSRQFSKETGETVTEFINRKRIEKAREIFSQGNHSITEVALMVGFDNHNYFSSVFKKITSLTPSQYLKGITSQKDSEK